MTRYSWRALAAAALVMQGACADPASPAVTSPLAFTWMEWPAAVTAAAPDTMLLQAYRDFCFVPSITFTTDNFQLTVHSQLTARNQVCPLEEAIPAFPVDTLVPLPALAAPYPLPVFYEVRATLSSPRGEAFERTAGTILLAAQPDTMRQMAGSAILFADGAGCVVLRGGSFLSPPPGGGFAHEYAIQNPPAFTDTLAIFVRAHAVTGAKPAACGTRPLAHLDYVETVLLP